MTRKPLSPRAAQRQRPRPSSVSSSAAAELPAAALLRRTVPERLGFRTTDDLAVLDGILGQPRAEAALAFGLAMGHDGFNIYALGGEGTGRHFLVRHAIERAAASAPTPSDWCYVNNFEEPNRPRALALPAGRGAELQREMIELVDAVQAALVAAFQSEEVQTRREVIEQELREHQEKALEAIGEEARQHGLAVVRTPMGLIFAPLDKGEPISTEAFEQLPEEEKARYAKLIGAMQERLQRVARQTPRWQAEHRAKVQSLRREVTRLTVEPLIDELRTQFSGVPAVLAYLDAVQADIERHAKAFVVGEEQQQGDEVPAESSDGKPVHRRYRVNLLVDRRGTSGAPIVYEDNPSYPNLLGRVEHQTQMGNLVTDYTLVRAGALQRANGGFLILDALALLRQPYAWEALKRALESRRARIESLSQALGLGTSVALEPEPVPLDLKVVLVGERSWYYLLAANDPDFPRLFKVAADFEETLPRDEASEATYARLLARLIRDEKLRAFDAPAVGRLLEESARRAGDAERLSLRSSAMVDLLLEANLLAGAEAETVGADAVERAVAAWIYRADRYRERWLEEVGRGTFLFATRGEMVGQVNGLAVVQLGGFAFGHPSRITARVRLGEGEVVNIEREVELSGPFHSKGVLILTGFLGERFARSRPLALVASLVFEQSYGGVDGDSASMAELCVLLSAIAGVPLRQGIALTGSVDQHGLAQPIGGVNEKIEGFFDVCRVQGLTGEQGVIIPRSNVKHLMLKREVVDAVAAGQFHVWAMTSIDDCLERLSGIVAGERQADGSFPPGSFNRSVDDRLAELAATKAELGKAKSRKRR